MRRFSFLFSSKRRKRHAGDHVPGSGETQATGYMDTRACVKVEVGESSCQDMSVVLQTGSDHIASMGWRRGTTRAAKRPKSRRIMFRKWIYA